MEENVKVMKDKDISKVTRNARVGGIVAKILTYAFLILMALIVLFPFYWMINSSLKTIDEYRMSDPTFWPHTVMWSNYTEAFKLANLGRLFLNTVIVGVVSTILSLIITVLSAFAFARLQFKGKNVLFAATGALMSPTLVQQGESIPGISHAVHISSESI